MAGGREPRLFSNLLWLLALSALVVAVVVVWGRGSDLLAPSRETAVVKVFRKASPAVVSLSAKPMPERPGLGSWSGPGIPWAEEFFRQYVGPAKAAPELNLGSGIIVDPRGFIITNEHVVNNTAWIQVTLADGETVAAEVWGTEPALDLAVVKVDVDRPLPFLSMGRSDDLMIGESAVAIGNPLGLGHTCTAGIVSSLHRSVQVGSRVYTDLIQTDAAVNPGNSGGPLLNIQGSLIGITSALNPEAEGIGFAIPIDRARRAVDDLIQYRYIPSGWLGISVQNPRQVSSALGLLGEGGVYVTTVEENGPAASALKPGDIVTAWDGAALAGVGDFVKKARALWVGEEVKLSVLREGESQKVKVKASAFPEALSEDWIWGRLGIKVSEGQVQLRARDGRILTRQGIFINEVAPNSPAMAVGLLPGDLIMWLNREEIGSRADFRRAVARLRGRENLFIRVQREGYPLFVTVPFQLSGERW